MIMDILRQKRAVSLYEDWAEMLFFTLLVIGFIVAAWAGSAVIVYLTIFLCGMMAGRLIYHRKKKLKFPYFLITLGFLFGYILGAFCGNKAVILIVFIVGVIISYRLHNKGIIK